MELPKRDTTVPSVMMVKFFVHSLFATASPPMKARPLRPISPVRQFVSSDSETFSKRFSPPPYANVRFSILIRDNVFPPKRNKTGMRKSSLFFGKKKSSAFIHIKHIRPVRLIQHFNKNCASFR
jgi:hypothetical protein